MSKTGRPNQRRGTRRNPRPERHITVRSVRRDPPDLRKLSRAVIALAMADAEAEANNAAEKTGAPDLSDQVGQAESSEVHHDDD